MTKQYKVETKNSLFQVTFAIGTYSDRDEYTLCIHAIDEAHCWQIVCKLHTLTNEEIKKQLELEKIYQEDPSGLAKIQTYFDNNTTTNLIELINSIDKPVCNQITWEHSLESDEFGHHIPVDFEWINKTSKLAYGEYYEVVDVYIKKLQVIYTQDSRY